jgi:hypothetical protein
MALSPFSPQSSPVELKDRLRAERRGHPFLLYRDGGGRQQIVDLNEAPEVLTVGRRLTSQLALPWDSGVSRIHARLECVGGYWTLSDDGTSRNGSFVNGSPLKGRRRLDDGDLLRFGNTVIAYCDPERPESRATAEQGGMATISSVSDAQRRVLLALCRPYKDSGGLATPASNRQIADELYLTVGAVKAHVRALFCIFGIGDLPQNQKRACLAERAFHDGVVTDRDL